jgi:hypothetical protein
MRADEESSSPTWRELYKAALFEGNKQELPLRIAEAERALILRARELFVMSGDNSEEGQAVDDAMYALRALRNCLELKTSWSTLRPRSFKTSWRVRRMPRIG